MSTAHIYIRFSHIDQREGTSTTRQRRDCLTHCADKGWDVGSILIDEGKSAFSGKNRDLGSELRRFEDEAEAGEHYGSILCVERLDRLSRQGHRATHAFICKLNDLGVSVATVDGGVLYQAGEELDLLQVMTLLIKAETAREESKKKSDRLRDAHAIRRAEVAAKGGVLRAVCPAWLEKKDGEYAERRDRVKLVKEIFDLTDKGNGSITVAKMLNRRAEPLWQRDTAKGEQKKQRAWDNGRIRKILSDPAVVGEHHCHHWVNGKRVPTGEVLKIFPRIIDADQFERVRASAALRAQTRGGGRSTVVANLVSGLATCRHCNGPMEYVRHRKAGATYKGRKGITRVLKHEDAALYCRAAFRHAQSCSNRTGITYYGFERALLDKVLHMALDDRSFSRNEEAAKLVRDLAERERDLDRAKTEAKSYWQKWGEKGGTSIPLEALAIESEAKVLALTGEVEALRKARAKAAGQASAEEHLSRIAEVRALMQDADLEVRAMHRRKVMEGLRSVITSIDCDVDRAVTISFAKELTTVRIQGGKVVGESVSTLLYPSGDFSLLGDERIQKMAATVAERIGKDRPPIVAPSRDQIRGMLQRQEWKAG